MAKGSATKDIKDVYIAVMGVTGAGKSSFIATISGLEVKVGHDLVSCTNDVEDVAFMYNERLRVHLIDTPGFDDTNRSDVAVLQDISAWLSDSFASGTKLDGIIFLHRISDPRMTGSSRRNIMMFKKLCGTNAYKSVVLATTMWSKVDSAEGAERERQLTREPEFWGSMAEKGSQVFRYYNTVDSARDIVDYIIRLRHPVVLAIQDELVNQSKEIEDTAAAIELNAEIIRERKRHQEELAAMREQMQEAIETRDKELQGYFQEEIEELQSKIDRGEDEQRRLTQSLEEVRKRKEAEFEAFRQQIQREQEEVRQRYQRDLEEHFRVAKEKEETLKKTYEAEARRLAEEQEVQAERARKREEEFRIQQEAAERRRALSDENTQRVLEQQRQAAEREQQAFRERYQREMEELRKESERQQRRYQDEREELRRRDKSRQRRLREDDEERQRQLQDFLDRRDHGGVRNAFRSLCRAVADKVSGRVRYKRYF